MEPEIHERQAFAVMGIEVRINPMAADYNDIWRNRYEPRAEEIGRYSTDEACLGLYFETGQEGVVDFIAGRAVEGVSDLPEGLVMREVPAGLEAVFACDMGTIGPTWGRIFQEWLPSSGYEYDPTAPAYERFPPATEPGPPPVFIHVPVRRPAG